MSPRGGGKSCSRRGCKRGWKIGEDEIRVQGGGGAGRMKGGGRI